MSHKRSVSHQWLTDTFFRTQRCIASSPFITPQIKMAAEADEPAEQNFVRKHALEQAKEFGLSVRDAATRVFSNAAGSYSANVGLAIENGGWEGEEQLQQQFVSRKGFAFNADKPGMMEQQVQKEKEQGGENCDTIRHLRSFFYYLLCVVHTRTAQKSWSVFFPCEQGWPLEPLLHAV